MNQLTKIITEELSEVMYAPQSQPSLTIVMPFEPRIRPVSELKYSLKIISGRAKEELRERYPAGIVHPLIQKLDKIINDLDFDTQKKSIAIYLSPVFEKVIYLDIEADEMIMVDGSFEIRDLVYNKEHLYKYLLLLISGKESRLYLGNSESFVRMVAPGSVFTIVNNALEKVLNFSDVSDRKQIIRDKFLHHIDNALDKVLKEHHVPLFIMGTEKILGHFKKQTRHRENVIKYIPGNYDDYSLSQLKAIMQPHIASWLRVKQKALLSQLEKAADSKKLVYGIKNVWSAVKNNLGRLLVVERNFMVAASYAGSNDSKELSLKPYSDRPEIMDAVDEVIEKVLESGGVVEFVDRDMLKAYNQIALVKYY